ncbi:AbrB family transcriptional regulator [Roseovarius aestuariivivens]|uniref:AbrB family transcriptional regulator n=1 Tax=Roseovarius aestuariivivens TaxID=1888910 RepID=UPI001081B768|nr:AbrB family transcriptional regulator [Roseovarius aestuariivivens]
MTRVLATLGLLALSGLAGLAAARLGLPLPFLIGPLLVSGAVATGLPHRLPEGYRFPPALRLVFIAVIGLMIGAQVTSELFSAAPRLALSFAALTLFAVLAHGFGYAVLRHLGGYDRPTAFYSATPGGLFESIALGEEAGADPARLTLHQFLRIIVVVTCLPIGLSLWLGEPVGSSAGMTLSRGAVPWSALPIIVAAGAAGLALGRALRLPAKQLTGPLAVAALLSLTGLAQLDIPQWLVNVAQVVVGTALGMRFSGLSRGLILRGLGLTLVSVTGMMALSAAFALVLAGPLDQPVDVMLISFAPGGVTEMALVALSLQANPAFVTLHHIFRIVITVLGLGLTARRFRARL